MMASVAIERMAERGRSRFEVVDGTVDRILGSHRTTDVTITEHTSTRQPVGSDHHHHTETHTFVNTSREFVALLEVGGRTLRLASSDYIAVAVGDRVRAICAPSHNGPLLVRDWHNKTRTIRFRNIGTPLNAAAQHIVVAVICLVVAAVATSFWDDFGWPAAVASVAGVALALYASIGALRTAREISQAHVALDRLAH